MEVEYSEAPKDRRPDGLGDLYVLPDETICLILTNLTPHDVGRLSCVSSVLYILCNEEPLWMSLCLNISEGQLQYRDSWKKTTMDRLHLSYECKSAKPMHFDGFYSLFLLRRHYRCHTTLSGFNFDNGNVDRRKDISLEDFQQEFDGKKPVLLSGLADDWPAYRTWTIDQLMLNYGDTSFRISQKSARKISMKFKDYVSYMQIQHDEDPLYIFDEKFGEVSPKLLEDYSVPYLFQEDYFDVLDREKRPPFRWFISGPERSGASWHVDPALTSAWNTLICGRKRWALYPPGRVPLGVTVHVNEEDGDVNIETPSSLQWWLDFYPLLPDEDKPIECTQLPGETIFVPSGWWHCVLNLENTVAVTQNFVNSTNFQFVCLDMAPGYQHKGVCRAGLLALDEGNSNDTGDITLSTDDSLIESDIIRKDKRIKLCEAVEEQEFSYDIHFLEQFLDKGKDHYSSPWSESNHMGPREMREWLSKLWVGKPGLRDLIWKGACLALNAGKWFECIREICAIHQLPLPTDDERLPVGTGSNPVYLFADNVVKLYVEDGLEASLHALGSELEFYSLLCKVDSPLKNHIPDVLASGIIFIENGSYKILPWDGKGVPDVVASLNLVPENRLKAEFPFGVWGKILFEFGAVTAVNQSITSKECSRIWPYIITKRCSGKIFAELRDTLSWQDNLNIASFLGEQVRNLHLLPFPSLNDSAFSNNEEKPDYLGVSSLGLLNGLHIPKEWGFFIRTLNRMKKDVCSRLTKWFSLVQNRPDFYFTASQFAEHSYFLRGDPIPSFLIDQVNEYIPDDFFKFLNIVQNGEVGEGKTCSWIHSDIMDDNIHMELCSAEHIYDNRAQSCHANGDHSDAEKKSWKTTHILDFSDLSLGDPICDLIPIHLDIFRGDPMLLKQFLESYKLPLGRKTPQHNAIENGDKFGRLSYITMCYCILHKENILGAIFSIWSELRTAKSWEEVEEAVWGDLNHYSGFS